MAKKTEPKIEKIEREYVIPLREKSRVVPRYKKTPKAVRTIKEFLVKHMKIYDRDLNKIKLDNYVNEYLWGRGIKRPPHKIKVKVIREGENIKVELVDYPTKLKFKKERVEKADKKAKEVAEKKKKEKQTFAEKAKEAVKPEEKAPLDAYPKGHEPQSTESGGKRTDEEKKEEKEKAAAGAEAQQKIAETAAKEMKKQKQPSMKQPKRPQRKALAK